MNVRNHKTFATLLAVFVLAAFTAFNCKAAPSAAQIMQSAYQNLMKSGGITASYTVSVKGHGKASGSLKVMGKKFFISYAGVSTWYDGKNQWNYNAESKEVTISVPTSEELQSVNPYSILSSYKSNYNVSLATSKIAGTYALLLTPKSASNPVKKATLYLRASDYQPSRLDVVSSDGVVSTIIITQIRTNQKLSDSAFKFNAKSYPGVSVVDLR